MAVCRWSSSIRSIQNRRCPLWTRCKIIFVNKIFRKGVHCGHPEWGEAYEYRYAFTKTKHRGNCHLARSIRFSGIFFRAGFRARHRGVLFPNGAADRAAGSEQPSDRCKPCADVSVCGAGKKQCECFGNDFGCIAPDSPCFDWCAGAGSSGQFAGASGKLAGAETGSERIAASKVELSDENCIYWR